MNLPWTEYRDQIAVVTGAASGMGAATARLLLEGGARVLALDIRDPGVAEVEFIQVDLCEPASIDAALKRLPDQIDTAFCCAGLPTTADPEKVFSVNFLANRLLVPAFADQMSQGGSISVIASLPYGYEKSLGNVAAILRADRFESGLAAFRSVWPQSGAPAYMFSKHCLMGFAYRSTAGLIKKGVRLNILCPGMTDTPMMPEFRKLSGTHMDKMPVSIGRWSSPEEQAQALMALNSPRLSYLAGATLANDGGLTAAYLAQDIERAAAEPPATPPSAEGAGVVPVAS